LAEAKEFQLKVVAEDMMVVVASEQILEVFPVEKRMMNLSYAWETAHK